MRAQLLLAIYVPASILMNDTGSLPMPRLTHSCCAAVVPALCAPAVAQSFVNGGFETGDLSGWTLGHTPNGTGSGQVLMYDIDGTGPLSTSRAAAFSVGQVTPMFFDQEGIELTQNVTLTGGLHYHISVDWAAQNNGGPLDDGGVFTVMLGAGGTSYFVGSLPGGFTRYGSVAVDYTPPSTASFRVGIRITRDGVPANEIQWVDNATISVVQSCYPNCDGSTAAPVLNVQDFSCFLQKFASGNPYANCDASTQPPTLNVADFSCFLQKYAAGCP
jgi:hypothetical protein